MKKNLVIFLIFFAAILLIGQVVFGSDYGEPGSEDDPIITKSYIEEKLVPRLKEDFREILIGEGELKKDGIEEEKGRDVFEVEELKAGESLTAGKSAQIIVRSGEGEIIDSPSGGVSDLTEAVDLREGENAPHNHLLLVPRDDGRGIKANSYMIIMIKGDYEID